jgi:GH25 family lysozyme M1 (1,4-beta-N-acetylmuramidase)
MARPASSPRRSLAPRISARSTLATALAFALGGALLGSAPGLTATASAANTEYVANCNTNLRATPNLGGTVIDVLNAGGSVTVDGTVTGDAWSVTCSGDWADNTWFHIIEVNGASTTSLYGVDAVYAATGLFSAAPTPPSDFLEGIDISHWQGSVDFAKVRGAGKRFVIAKATEGIGWTDANWTTYRDDARAAGLAVTGYHFARPDGNPTKPKEEAAWFVSQLGLEAGMLIPALDLERAGTLTKAELTAWVQAWLDEVYALTGVRPMIYTSPAFWRNALGDTRTFADQGYTVLWIAHWGVNAPSIPASNWGGHGWTFWQYTSDGTVPGISGRVDLDRYNGLDLTPVTVGADFSLSPAAAVKTAVAPGGSTSFGISINRTFFTIPVDLSVSGLPPGASATIDPDPVGGDVATLTVSTSKSGTVTPNGTYPLTVSGTANGLTRTMTVSLVVSDVTPPVAVAPASRLYAISTLGTSTTRVRTSWSATDDTGVAGYTLQRQVNGGSWSNVSLSSLTSLSIAQSLTNGTSYRYRLRASDVAGNLSTWAYGPTFRALRTQQSSSSVKFSGTWYTAKSSSYSGGSTKYTKSKGASASFTFTGSSIAWASSKSSARGSADVYLDGVYRATVSLYSTSYKARQVVFAFDWGTSGTHTIKIVNRATSGHPRIDVDAFVRIALG